VEIGAEAPAGLQWRQGDATTTAFMFRPFRPCGIIAAGYLGLRSSDSLQPRLSYRGLAALAGGRTGRSAILPAPTARFIPAYGNAIGQRAHHFVRAVKGS